MKTMQNPAGFRTVFTGSTGINLKQQNRTDHLLQKPDTFICYRQKEPDRKSLNKTYISFEANGDFENKRTQHSVKFSSGSGVVSKFGSVEAKIFIYRPSPLHGGVLHDSGACV